jgi:hypothetical protein
MRKIVIPAAIIAASVVTAPGAAFANAAPANQKHLSNLGVSGWIGSTQGGKNNATTQFKASYDDSLTGPVTCTGVHHSGRLYSRYGQDSETCTSTTGVLANPQPESSPGFSSDFWNLQGQIVLGTATLTAETASSYSFVWTPS